MPESPIDSVEANSSQLPEVLRQIAAVLPQFEGDALDSQLQVFDVFLGLLSPSVRPEVVDLLRQAAANAQAKRVRVQIEAAADAVASGGRAAMPPDHARDMRAYQAAFLVDNPRAFDPLHDEPQEPLPSFTFHPDPVATGSVVASPEYCACCDRSRGYVYEGPVYGEGDGSETICPWCIADGSANRELGVSFVDKAGISLDDDDDLQRPVAPDMVDELANRTPGFCAWQQEFWWTHCASPAEFLGPAGKAELTTMGEGAIAGIRASSATHSDKDWQALLSSLSRDGSPTAYVFRCRVCAKFGGYHDFD